MKLTNYPEIETIIFDLGNVIIDLDIEATDDAFENLFGYDYKEIKKELKEKGVFKKYEMGKISTSTFLNEIGAYSDEVNHDEIKYAWNAMLLSIPDERFKILKDCAKNYRIFCLSNTNKLHVDFINKQLKSTKHIDNLNPYFEKVYFSHEIGMRKPNVDIFEKVISDNKLNPEKTLFIDDTKKHLEGAKSAGLQTLHLSDDLNLSLIFS